MSPPYRMRARTAVPALFAALGLVLAQAISASANPPVIPPPTLPTSCPPICSIPLPPLSFVVVGDSYTSGEGASHFHIYVGNASRNEDWRHQSGFAAVHVAWAYLEMGRHPVGTVTISPTELLTARGRDRLFFHPSSGAKTKHLCGLVVNSDGVVVGSPSDTGRDPTA